MKKKILILSTIEGHASLADAVVDALNPAYATTIFSYPDPSLHLYRIIYRKYPWLMKYIFNFMNSDLGRKLIHLVISRTYSQQLLNVIDNEKPDLIISVNYGFDPSIARHRKQITQPYINITTDPRTFYDWSISTTADLNCLFDEYQQERAQKARPQAKTMITGWFVRQEFETTKSTAHVRKELNLKPQTPTFLVIGGWEGSEQILTTSQLLLSSPTPIQVVVICGKNKKLKQKVERAIAAHGTSNASFQVLGFTQEIAAYMQASDVTIGKAGPNTVFESVATGTPFVATTHNAGLEDGNIELIEELGLGIVAEEPTQLTDVLTQLCQNPDILKEFQPSIEKQRQKNLKAKPLLKQAVDSLLGE